jgi:hypothetical protein
MFPPRRARVRLTECRLYLRAQRLRLRVIDFRPPFEPFGVLGLCKTEELDTLCGST